MTSNPTIFEKAMGHSDRYDDAVPRALERDRDVEGSSTSWPTTTSATPPICSGRRSTAPGRGRLRVVRGRGLAGVRRRPRRSRPPQHHQAEIDRPNVLIKVPGTDRGCPCVRGADRARRQRQRHAAVRGIALRGDRRGLPARARAPRGEGGVDRVGCVGGELLRLARGHQGRRRARGHRPRGPARQGCGRQREDRIPARSSGSSADRAGRRSPPRARAFSARFGPRPRPRTLTIPTRCTSTT